MVKEVNLKEMEKEAVEVFTTGYMCSETVVYVLNKEYDLGMPDDIVAISTGFPYGFGNGGNVCGAVAGATMCLGKVFGRTTKGDPKFQKCLDLVREFNDKFTETFDTTICPELIKDYEFPDPDRKEHCINIVKKAIEVFADIMEREMGIKVIR